MMFAGALPFIENSGDGAFAPGADDALVHQCGNITGATLDTLYPDGLIAAIRDDKFKLGLLIAWAHFGARFGLQPLERKLCLSPEQREGEAGQQSQGSESNTHDGFKLQSEIELASLKR